MSLAVWCAVVLLGGATCAPAPQLAPSSALAPLSLQSIDAQQLDDEALSYLVGEGGAGGRYGPAAAAAWRGVLDPGLYVIGELPHFQSYESQRQKRKMPSLSISNPMEVLRQRLVLEIARKQMREHAARQAEENRLFLQNVGKRGMWGEGALDSRRDDN